MPFQIVKLDEVTNSKGSRNKVEVTFHTLQDCRDDRTHVTRGLLASRLRIRPRVRFPDFGPAIFFFVLNFGNIMFEN